MGLYFFNYNASSMNECSTLLYFLRHSIDCPWNLYHILKRCICLSYFNCLSWVALVDYKQNFEGINRCICLKHFICLPWIALGSLLYLGKIHYERIIFQNEFINFLIFLWLYTKIEIFFTNAYKFTNSKKHKYTNSIELYTQFMVSY